MGQYEVLQILKENPNKWFTTKELADLTKVTTGSVASSIKRMGNLVIRRYNSGDNNRLGVVYKLDGVFYDKN